MTSGDLGLRRILVWLVLLGTIGLTLELLLLEHTESFQQVIPFATLALAIPPAVALAVRPTHRTVRLFQGAMLLMLAAGALGLWLHYSGNVAFELEMEPETGGTLLVWRALRGATPALAPGAMVQLGLLGLILTYRHPSLRERGAEPRKTEES